MSFSLCLNTYLLLRYVYVQPQGDPVLVCQPKMGGRAHRAKNILSRGSCPEMHRLAFRRMSF